MLAHARVNPPLRAEPSANVRYTCLMRLSAFILAKMEPILQDWESFARSLGTVTSSMDAAALRDHAQLILRAVAADLETPQSLAQQEAKGEGDAPARPAYLPPSAATSHGVLRAEEGFSLEEMVSEYRAPPRQCPAAVGEGAIRAGPRVFSGTHALQ